LDLGESSLLPWALLGSALLVHLFPEAFKIMDENLRELEDHRLNHFMNMKTLALAWVQKISAK